MYIRFHKGQFVDAVIPTSVGVAPSASPADIVWEVPTDVNPSKTVNEVQNIQAVDPITGQPQFDNNGLPVWETEEVENEDGTTSDVIVTQEVPVTYTLMENPNIFTQEDIEAVTLSYTVVN